MTSLAITHPSLAAQLEDSALANVLTAGSGKKPRWICPARPTHRWTAAVYSRTSGAGCPICSGKQVLAGDNDLRTTHPQLAQELVDPDIATTITAGTHALVQWRCTIDARHVWEAKPSNRLLGRGCPVCAGRLVIPGINDLATTHPDIAAQLVDEDRAHRVIAGSTSRARWRCDRDPQHLWSARIVDRTKARGTGCPYCSGRAVLPGQRDLATTHPDLAAQLMNPDQATEVSAGSDRLLLWRCPEHPDHPWEASVANRVAGNGCRICANQIVAIGINDLATTHPDLAAQLVDPQQARTVTAGSKTVLLWQCPRVPSHTWSAACYHRTSLVPTGCPRCFGPAPSQAEQTLADIITRLIAPEPVRQSVRTLLGDGREIDILIPSRQTAIEFNGLYWHSRDAGRAVDHHQRKSQDAAEAGLQLIHVWEDDWRDRPEVVLRMLAHKLGATQHLSRIIPTIEPEVCTRSYARSLHVDEATSREAASFLRRTHIQGPTALSRRFVLRESNGSIRALLGLRAPRANARAHRRAGQWEIQRYATSGVVVGGFSRLLAHAERTLRADGIDLTQWVSFSAADVSDGGMYRTAGFTADADLSPDYTYAGTITGWTRRPKERFQRRTFRENPDLLWDESWSEREAASANGLVRIYDAGKTRWVKNVLSDIDAE